MRRTSSMRRATSVLLVSLGLAASGCDEATPMTTLEIRAYGEEFVEERIPASELVDGWEIELGRMLVAIDAVEAEGEPLPGGFVVDLRQPSRGEGHLLGGIELPALEHPHLSFRVTPPSAQAQTVAATADDLQVMLDEQLSILVEGRARRGDEEIGFRWGFHTTTVYSECHGAARLGGEDPARAQLTIHADHLFYDDLDSPEPNVAFDLVAAADADDDGEVSPEELRAVDIGGQARYQVGSRDIGDLWGFIEAQTGTLGHIDGEGHCETDR